MLFPSISNKGITMHVQEAKPTAENEHNIQNYTSPKELRWYKSFLALGLTLGIVFTLLEVFNSAPIAERGFFFFIALGGYAMAMAFFPIVQRAKEQNAA
jgi:hypothetical protein